MTLLTNIENEIKNVAGTVETHVHDVLAKHLTFANVAAHVAHEAATLASDPLIQAAEATFLPAGARTALAEVLAQVDTELAKLTAPAVPAQALPEAAPAEAQAS